MNEVGDIFVLGREAGGLTGTVQTIHRSVGFNANSGFLAMTNITQCGAGKQQTDYMNNIFAPDRSGVLLTLFQNHTGKDCGQGRRQGQPEAFVWRTRHY